MQKILLLETPVRVICHNDHNIFRHKVEKFLDVKYYKLGQLINILYENIDNSVLIIEDIIEINREYYELELPYNTDAVYLGLSKCAGSKTINCNEGELQFLNY